MGYKVHLDLTPVRPEDVPNPNTTDFQAFLDDHFAAGQLLIDSMEKWPKQSTKVDGLVQIHGLTNTSSCNDVRKTLSIKEYWCGRRSIHTPASIQALVSPQSSSIDKAKSATRAVTITKRTSDAIPMEHDQRGEIGEVGRRARVMESHPHGLYERFRRGLLEYHSEHEREYIDACRETECLQVFLPHGAEVWRLTYVTPPPTNPRTFVVLLLSRELKTEPLGERSFMNVSLPFDHPKCPPKQSGEKSRVRGTYVSVEHVRETARGTELEWKMATSSDAGGNIPRFVTDRSLPGSISEDVPSFLRWMIHRFPDKREDNESAGTDDIQSG